jgi:hypothetical protein
LPPGSRVAVAVAAPAAALVLLGAALWLARREVTPAALARRVDSAAAANGRVRAGVDLLLAGEQSSPLTAGLAALAVADADRIVAATPAARVVPFRPATRSLATLAVLLAVAGLAALCLPRVLQAEWLRFADPYGDHPPYSRVHYGVEPGAVRLPYGAALDVRVTTGDAPVEQLQLVMQSAEGNGEESLPLFAERGGAWSGTVANVTAPFHYFVRSHAGRSARFRVDVVTVPRIEGVRFRITPPSYTNRAAYEGPLPQGGIAGLPGTEVRAWAKSNRPLSGGTLRPPAGQALAMDPAGADGFEAAGRFEIRAPGKLRLTVRDTDGQDSAEEFTTPVAVLTDEPPLVRLLEPPERSLATPTASVPVVIDAEDDYGLARVELYRSLNESRYLPLEVAVRTRAPTHVRELVQLPLGGLGLGPGDEIKLFARAEDNDPAGRKGAETPVAVVRIISQSEFEQMARTQRGIDLLRTKYAEARRHAESAADEAERLRKKARQRPAENKAIEDDRDELRQFAARLRAEAEELQESARHPLGNDLDDALTNQLQRLSRRLEQEANALEALSRRQGLTSGQIAAALDALANTLDHEKQALGEGAVEPVELLAKVFPLLEDSARFVELYLRQRDLAARLKAVSDVEREKDPNRRVRLRERQAEQEHVRKALARLLDDIENHVTALPDDPAVEELRASAAKFVEEVRASGASEAMAEAEAGLAEFSGKRGYEGARTAVELLDAFVGKGSLSEGMSGAGTAFLRFHPMLTKALGRTVEQLLAAAGHSPQASEGGGRGASSARNPFDNVGLYGTLPGLGQSAVAGPAGGGSPGAGGRSRDGPLLTEPVNSAAGKARPAGASEVTVPLPYRRRVAEYFQRVADDAGGKR